VLMTDEEWEQRRDRAIAAAFQTGRAVFADSEGQLRYADGDCELIAADVGVIENPPVKSPLPLPRATVRRSWWSRARSWLETRRGR
jgi:hypothetical protein